MGTHEVRGHSLTLRAGALEGAVQVPLAELAGGRGRLRAVTVCAVWLVVGAERFGWRDAWVMALGSLTLRTTDISLSSLHTCWVREGERERVELVGSHGR